MYNEDGRTEANLYINAINVTDEQQTFDSITRWDINSAESSNVASSGIQQDRLYSRRSLMSANKMTS